MRHVDYAWRLDDDSLLLSDITYDIVRYMHDHHIIYGYTSINFETRDNCYNLWAVVRSYIRKNNIITEFFNKWPIRQLYLNNFAVSSMLLWRSQEYRDYIYAIDQSGGIYQHRWGDAPLKSIAISMFVPRNKTHYFCDLG